MFKNSNDRRESKTPQERSSSRLREEPSTLSPEERDLGAYLADELEELFQTSIGGLQSTTVRFPGKVIPIDGGKLRKLVLVIRSRTGTFKVLDDIARLFLDCQVLPETTLVHLIIYCVKEPHP